MAYKQGFTVVLKTMAYTLAPIHTIAVCALPSEQWQAVVSPRSEACAFCMHGNQRYHKNPLISRGVQTETDLFLSLPVIDISIGLAANGRHFDCWADRNGQIMCNLSPGGRHNYNYTPLPLTRGSITCDIA